VPHKTSAWPLALIYVVLVVYASLYPFEGWRDQGIAPWAFLASPLPKYWTGFDVAANVAGYVPLGFLLALSAMRRGGGTQVRAVLLATGAALGCRWAWRCCRATCPCGWRPTWTWP
jgi:VanZ family protein